MTIPTQEQIELLSKDFQIRLAIYAAELVLDLVEPKYKAKASKAISVTKLYLEGKVTQEDCRVAADAAYYAADATTYAAYAAGYAAADAAYAGYAADAAYAVERASKANPLVIPNIVAYYEELRDFDKNFERDILGGEGG